MTWHTLQRNRRIKFFLQVPLSPACSLVAFVKYKGLAIHLGQIRYLFYNVTSFIHKIKLTQNASIN